MVEDIQMTGRQIMPTATVEKTAIIRVSSVDQPNSRIELRFGGKNLRILIHMNLNEPIRSQSVPVTRIIYRDPQNKKLAAIQNMCSGLILILFMKFNCFFLFALILNYFSLFCSASICFSYLYTASKQTSSGFPSKIFSPNFSAMMRLAKSLAKSIS